MQPNQLEAHPCGVSWDFGQMRPNRSFDSNERLEVAMNQQLATAFQTTRSSNSALDSRLSLIAAITVALAAYEKPSFNVIVLY